MYTRAHTNAFGVVVFRVTEIRAAGFFVVSNNPINFDKFLPSTIVTNADQRTTMKRTDISYMILYKTNTIHRELIVSCYSLAIRIELSTK